MSTFIVCHSHWRVSVAKSQINSLHTYSHIKSNTNRESSHNRTAYIQSHRSVPWNGWITITTRRSEHAMPWETKTRGDTHLLRHDLGPLSGHLLHGAAFTWGDNGGHTGAMGWLSLRSPWPKSGSLVAWGDNRGRGGGYDDSYRCIVESIRANGREDCVQIK